MQLLLKSLSKKSWGSSKEILLIHYFSLKIILIGFSVFRSLFLKILTEAGSRTSFSPTEWVDLAEQDRGEQSAGLRLSPVTQPSTRNGREQTCSRQGGLSFYGTDKGDDWGDTEISVLLALVYRKAMAQEGSWSLNVDIYSIIGPA